jgi:hypothetical protein
MEKDSTICNICGGVTRPLLRVDHTPPMQNRYYATHEAAVASQTTDVAVAWCCNCLHISIHKNHETSFDPQYNNEQTFSPAAKAHLQKVARSVAEVVPLDASIVEIGCGRGEFLEQLHASGFSNLQGYDPVAPSPTAVIRNELWKPDALGFEVDLFVLRHTLEEIGSFAQFINLIGSQLSPKGHIYIELTNGLKLAESGNIWSYYPECHNIFSTHSLQKAIAKSGMFIERIVEYDDGNWLGVWVRPFSSVSAQTLLHDDLKHLTRIVEKLPKPIVLWGAAGRGGNFVAFLKLGLPVISHLADVNESKWGLFIPPYGQSVISPAQVLAIKPATVLVASKKFKQEIMAQLPETCVVISIDELI